MIKLFIYNRCTCTSLMSSETMADTHKFRTSGLLVKIYEYKHKLSVYIRVLRRLG